MYKYFQVLLAKFNQVLCQNRVGITNLLVITSSLNMVNFYLNVMFGSY